MLIGVMSTGVSSGTSADFPDNPFETGHLSQHFPDDFSLVVQVDFGVCAEAGHSTIKIADAMNYADIYPAQIDVPAAKLVLDLASLPRIFHCHVEPPCVRAVLAAAGDCLPRGGYALNGNWVFRCKGVQYGTGRESVNCSSTGFDEGDCGKVRF
jgi:hypothetical protein